MNIPQAFSWWCFANRGVEPEALLSGAADIGYAGVDLIDEELWPLAKKCGLAISAINGHKTFGLNRPENAAAIEAEIRASLAKAAQWNIPRLICFTGNRQGLNDEAGLANCAENLQRLAPLAEDAGVTLIVELFNSKIDHPDYQGDSMDFGIRLCEAVASPNVKLLYDIYHMQVMEGDVIRTIGRHHSWFAHYHTAGNPGRGQPDATQELNYPAIYRAIAQTGYRGVISHEFLPGGKPLEALRIAYQDCHMTMESQDLAAGFPHQLLTAQRSPDLN